MIKKIKNFSKRLIKNIIERNNLVQIYKLLLKENAKPTPAGISCVIFSKDRALQLDALLNSFFFSKIGDCELYVIYSASTPQHLAAYNDVATLYELNATFVYQENKIDFKDKLLSTLNLIKAGKIFFLVDDILITEPINFEVLQNIDTSKNIFSLRMGENLNYSYVVAKQQPLPEIEKSENFIYWDWSKGVLEWAYPLSVDGHLFNKSEIEVLARLLNYFSPNTFENALQDISDIFKSRTGMSYAKSAIFNNPCNKVQLDVGNFHGAVHQDILLNYWIEGKRIDFKQYLGHLNKSVHEEVELKFNDPNGK